MKSSENKHAFAQEVLESVNSSISKTKDLMSLLDDDRLEPTIGLLDWAGGYVKVLIDNPRLLNDDFDSKPIIRLDKILDRSELLIFVGNLLNK